MEERSEPSDSKPIKTSYPVGTGPVEGAVQLTVTGVPTAMSTEPSAGVIGSVAQLGAGGSENSSRQNEISEVEPAKSKT
jgi:hypothetical protein